MREIQKFLNELRASGKYILLFNILERLTFFVFYVSIARYVDKNIYGFIVSVSSLTNIIATIFDLGIPFFIQRESTTNENTKSFLLQSIFLKLILIIVFLPLPFIYYHSDINNWLIILIVSLINFFSPINQILISYLNGKYLFKENYQAILISRIPYLIFLIFASIFKINFYFSLFSILSTLIAQNIILLRFARLEFKDLLKIKFQPELISMLIRKSLPFGLGLIFIMIYDRFDVLLIQKLLSNETVAIYSAAYSLYRNSSIFSSIILIKVFNDASKFYVENRRLDLKTFLNSGKVLLILSLILILIFNLFGEILIKILYTSKFINSVGILETVSFALPLLFLNNLTGVSLNSIHKEKITMFSTFIGMLINLISNILLIPELGVYGGVISTIITELSILIFQLIFVIKYSLKTE